MRMERYVAIIDNIHKARTIAEIDDLVDAARPEFLETEHWSDIIESAHMSRTLIGMEQKQEPSSIRTTGSR